MLALLGLVGVAMSAVLFVDFGNSEDDSEADTSAAADDETATTSVGDLLIDDQADAPGDTETYRTGQDDAVQTNDVTLVSDTKGASATASEVLGGTGADQMLGTDQDDLLMGNSGIDSLFGRLGDDMLMGGAGDDLLDGGAGDDRMYGGSGDDMLRGDAGSDTMTGGAGFDTLYGGDGADVLDGQGDDARDLLVGGAGDDLILGGAGDVLQGGDGADTFSFVPKADAVVDDFDPDEDVIEITYDSNPPELSTQLTDAGLQLIADGETIATLGGVTSLDVSTVRLVAA